VQTQLSNIEKPVLSFDINLTPPRPPNYAKWIEDRAYMTVLCLKSDKEKEFQLQKCRQPNAEGCLHFLQFFCFIAEPRDLQDRDKPFTLYEYQIEEVRFLVDVLFRCASAHGPRENILYEKSRDMGVSWVILYVFLWFLLFHGASFQVGSRKEEEVDKTGDMDTPFGKLKYALLTLERTFPWLLPAGWNFKRDTGHMIIRNPMGGQIVGESANSEFGRGGRNLATVYDEFPKWPYASESWRASYGTTKVRIAVGTPGETDTDKFSRLRYGLDGDIIVRTIHWTKHPDKAADLRVINGKPTSSWYIEECRTNSPEDIAKELDISYQSSIKGRIFDTYGVGHQQRELKPVNNEKIFRAWDPGLHFCVVWGQVDTYGRLLFLKELYLEGAHLDDMAVAVLDISARYFPDFEFVDIGDPYGAYRQVSAQREPEFTVLQNDYGIYVQTKFLGSLPMKDRVKARIQILQRKMSEYNGVTNTPCVVVDPDECPLLDRGFGGEYKYKTDINGVVIPIVDERHPIEDAIDCGGMIGLKAFPWGIKSLAKAPLQVRQSKIKWARQGGGHNFVS